MHMSIPTFLPLHIPNPNPSHQSHHTAPKLHPSFIYTHISLLSRISLPSFPLLTTRSTLPTPSAPPTLRWTNFPLPQPRTRPQIGIITPQRRHAAQPIVAHGQKMTGVKQDFGVVRGAGIGVVEEETHCSWMGGRSVCLLVGVWLRASRGDRWGDQWWLCVRVYEWMEITRACINI